jgi:hypothetical protein
LTFTSQFHHRSRRIGLADLRPGAKVASIRVGDIDGAKAGQTIRDRRRDISGNCHIAGTKRAERFGIGRKHKCARFLQCRLGPGRKIDRLRAGLGKGNSRGLPDPARGPCDKDDLASGTARQCAFRVDRVIDGMMGRQVKKLGLDRGHGILSVA